MRTRSAVVMSILSIIATTSVSHTSPTFADHGWQAVVGERIGHGGSTYSFYTYDGGAGFQSTEDKVSQAYVSQRIGHGGSVYSSVGTIPNETQDCQAGKQRVTVVERVGHGGSTYSSGKTANN